MTRMIQAMGALLLAAALAVSAPLCAFAAESATPSPQATASPEGTAPNPAATPEPEATPSPDATEAPTGSGVQVLAIDTLNRYDSMTKSWGQGYLPTVGSGKVKVVLPLVLNPQSGVATLPGDSITVKPDFGDAASSPFVFSNLEAKVALANHAVNGTAATVRCWLLSYSFQLESRRVNGRYPITFHVSYSLPGSGIVTQDFAVYVTVKDGIDPNATPRPVTSAATPKPKPQPKLIVSRYAVNPAVASAGEEFTLDFDIENTSDSVAVRNIKVTVKAEGTDLVPAGGSNTLYIKSLDKSETIAQNFRMKANFDAEPKPQKVTIAIDYEDGNGTVYSASDDMVVQVAQPIRLEWDKPNLPASVTAGDTVPVSMGVFNMGKTALHNVLCRVQASGLLPEASAFLGNMDPGGSKTAELYVFVGTKNMKLSDKGDVVTDATGSDLYGETSGFVVISYEDEFGKKYTQQVELKTTIAEPVTPQPTATAAPEEKEAAGQWWVSVLVAGVLLAGAAAVLIFRARKRAAEVAGAYETD